MTKARLTLCALTLLLASTAFAQQDVPGEARALPSTPATKSEKQAARQHRNAVSKEMVKNDEGRTDLPQSAGTSGVSKDEKAAARLKRRTAGAEAARDDSGRLPEAPTAR